jgi:hypothetical protein
VIEEAVELARSAVERWNAGDLDAVYADWDPEIVVRPDSNFPDAGELYGVPAARRFWEDQREFMGSMAPEYERSKPACRDLSGSGVRKSGASL